MYGVQMDPVELLELCARGADEGCPPDVTVPRVFSAGEFEDAWRRTPTTVRRLLDELLCGSHADDGLDLLMKSGALHALIPELVAIKDLNDDPLANLHKDVWRHTTQVVMGVPANVELRWAALMHDIGKSKTRRFNGKRVTFHNHDVVGARMFDNIEHRLDLFRDDATLFTTVRSFVLNHLRPASYKKTWTDSGVRRLLTDLGGLRNFERLMSLSRADLTTKMKAKRDRALARAAELEERVKLVYTEDHAPKLPKGTMGLIIEKKLCPVGPGLNNVRAWLEMMMRDGRLPLDRDAEFYATVGFETYVRERTKKADEFQQEMLEALNGGHE